MNWYVNVLKNYAEFSGRAQRKEYWMFMLFHLLISFALGFVDALMGSFNPEVGIGLLGGVYTLAVLIPALAVTVRRLHDTGRSGWWFLIVLIPVVGPIVLLVFMILDSEDGNNDHGLNPKAVAAAA